MADTHDSQSHDQTPSLERKEEIEERKILQQLESGPSLKATAETPAEATAEGTSDTQTQDDPDALLSDTLRALKRLIDEVQDVLKKNQSQETNPNENNPNKEAES